MSVWSCVPWTQLAVSVSRKAAEGPSHCCSCCFTIDSYWLVWALAQRRAGSGGLAWAPHAIRPPGEAPGTSATKEGVSPNWEGKQKEIQINNFKNVFSSSAWTWFDLKTQQNKVTQTMQDNRGGNTSNFWNCYPSGNNVFPFLMEVLEGQLEVLQVEVEGLGEQVEEAIQSWGLEELRRPHSHLRTMAQQLQHQTALR